VSNFFLKLEFFGGLLLERNSQERWELNFETALFLFLHRYFSENSDKISIIKAVLKKDDLQIHFEILNICNDFDSNYDLESCLSVDKAICVVKGIYDEIKTKRYLSFPESVSIYPTLDCQLNCKFCFIDPKIRSINSSSISDNIDWKKIINECVKNGVLSFSILGGEPFLYEGLYDILTELQSSGVKSTITTNGVHVDDNVFELIINSDSIIPIFSIQALNERNMELMSIDYNVSISNLRRFIERDKLCRVNSVLTTQSDEEIFEIIDFCVSNGIKRYSLAFFMQNHEGLNAAHGNSLEHIRDFQERLNRYLHKMDYNNKISVPIEGCVLYSSYHSDEAHGLVETEFDRLFYGCECGNMKLDILPNGDVYPCVAFNGTSVKDSILNYSSVLELWHNSPILSDFRNIKNNNEPYECSGCNFLSFCRGGCPLRNFKKYGTCHSNRDVICNASI